MKNSERIKELAKVIESYQRRYKKLKRSLEREEPAYKRKQYKDTGVEAYHMRDEENEFRMPVDGTD